MHENVLQKKLYVKVENFGIEAKSQRGFEKNNMPNILMVESTTILSSITMFKLILIPMFSHFDSLKEFRSKSLQSKFSTTTIVIIVIAIKGGNSSHEGRLMIVDGESQFDQIVLAFSNQFKTKNDQLVETKKINQCVMVLVKNVIATIVDNRSFQTQPFTILSKMIDDNAKA
jgi:hypothetical protein